MTLPTQPKIPPPERLLKPANIPEKRLMGPGPSNMSPQIAASLSQPLLGHLHAEFIQIMDDTKAGIQYLFQTNNSLTFAVSGTGHAGMEAALLNLLEQGERILVVQNGIWGQRAADLAKRLNLNVDVLKVDPGQVAKLEAIQEAVERFKPHVVFVCHGESSTGVLHPLDGIGDICHENGAMFLVDTVASIGATPFYADDLGVDCVYAATQKVLNVPPGLAPISFSDRALAKIKARKTRVASFYFDALELGNYWGCFEEPRRYHHTAPISTVYALREGLAALAKEGIEESVTRHQDNVKLLYQGVEAIGLKLFVDDESIRNPCLTTIRVPENVQWKDVVDRLMADRIEISGGLGPTVGKVWRIGTFGINSDPAIIQRTVEALKAALGPAPKL